jgi:hypothetical protein
MSYFRISAFLFPLISSSSSLNLITMTKDVTFLQRIYRDTHLK